MNWNTFSIFIFLAFFIVGCSGNTPGEEAIEYEPQSTDNFENISYDPTEQSERTKQVSKTLPFTLFNLEIDYVDTLSYEIDYRHTGNQTKAVIDELGEEKIMGKKALNQLTPHFKELSFDEDSSEDEVIADVLSVFGLDETFKEFKLEVTFSNGEQVEYER